MRVLGPLAVALDEAVANREGREERDLLGRDRLRRASRTDRAPAAAGTPRAPSRAAARPGPPGATSDRTRRGRKARRAASAPLARSRESAATTRTPPGAASIRTSRPPTTRCRPPSCQRFATSGPKARKRSVEISKSYGSGKRSSNGVQVVERLVGDALLVEVSRQPAPGEDPVGGERAAAVGVAVADVDDLALRRERRALARLPADRADRQLAPDRPPAVRDRASIRFACSSTSTPSRSSTGSISSWKPLETTSGCSAASSGRPGRTRTFSTTQATTSSCGACTVANCALDLLAQRDLPGEELLAEALALLPVPELLEHHQQRVALGDRPVPVDDEGARHQ